MFTPQTIFCNGCGKAFRTDFGGWVGPGHTRVCGKECHDKIEMAYARCILGKLDPGLEESTA